MRQHHHEAGAVCARVNFKVLGDADEAGVVVALVLNGRGKALKTVELNTGEAGDGGDIVPAGLGDHSCCLGGVLAGDDLNAGKRLEICAALAYGLLVGVNFLNVGKLRAWEGEQVVVYLDAHTLYDAEAVLHHEVVHLVDRACGAVFEGDHAVAAQPLFNCGEYGLEVLEIEDVRISEYLVAGKLRICALNALAGDQGCVRQKLRSVLDGAFYLIADSRMCAQKSVLSAAAELENERIQRKTVLLEVVGELCGNVGKLFALPCRVVNVHCVFSFILCNLGGKLHALGKKLGQLVVNCVYLGSYLVKIHFVSFLFSSNAS